MRATRAEAPARAPALNARALSDSPSADSPQENPAAHVHRDVLLGYMVGEFGGTWPVYHCAVCGTVREVFGSSEAEIVPEMALAAGVRRSAVYRVVPQVPAKTARRAGRRLGRSLADLVAAARGPRMLPGGGR